MSKQRKPKEPVVASNIWQCPHCEGTPEFEHKQMMAHLKIVHGVTEMKGNRSMRMHMDASDHYIYQWDWEIEGKTYHQTVLNPRNPRR